MVTFKEEQSVFAVHFTVKGIQDGGFQLYKWVCQIGCEAYKRRLAYSVTVRISA